MDTCSRLGITLQQLTAASGATWLDRQLIAREPVVTGVGFGAEVRDAIDRRVEHLADEGLARRQGQRVIFARDLIEPCESGNSTVPQERLPPKPGSLTAHLQKVNTFRVYTKGSV